MSKTRVVHCKLEPYDILIDRTTKWGNKYIIGKDGTRREVIAKNKADLIKNHDLIKDLHELDGKTLGCWCKTSPDVPCHGDTLIELLEESKIAHPRNDGIFYINIYSQGKTELGRQLSNFALSEFTYEPYGTFKSVEGFWYWYFSGQKEDILKKLWGYQAKQFGQKICNDKGRKTFAESDKEIILEAIRCKLRQNKIIRNMLAHSVLPFRHFYCFGSKVVEPLEYSWITDEFERIRKILQKKLQK